MSEDDELNRFAEEMMRKVRDDAIHEADRLISGKLANSDGDRWRKLLSSEAARQAAEALVPEVVDLTLFALLNAIDNGELPLSWRQSDGSLISLNDLGHGEMGGWLMGSPGWRHAFSRERFFDLHSNLKLDLGRYDDNSSSS